MAEGFDFHQPSTWTKMGFEGPHPFGDVRRENAANVPCNRGGIYVLTHNFGGTPEFVPEGPVRLYKGRNASYRVEELERRWRNHLPIVYVGKADGVSKDYSLRTRLTAYLSWGRGVTGHSGGRSIWQLRDVDRLSLWWKCLSAGVAATCESELLRRFKALFGNYPFANRRG